MSYAVYILKCSDGTYCTGLTKDLVGRIQDHQKGIRITSYTCSRRPIELVWNVVTESYREALLWEQKIKGWSRAKKEALIRSDIDGIHEIVKAERKRREQNKKQSR